MAPQTTRLQLPLIAASQAQKHVTFNETMRGLDALVFLNVEGRDVVQPPTSPSEGARYITAANSTGAWSGHGKQIAIWQDGAWLFYLPQRGWIASIGASTELSIFDGAAWRTTTQNMTELGVGALPTTANPIILRVNNILATARSVADGGDGTLRMKLNRDSVADTASIIFQTGYSGAAEMGLSGTAGFGLKTSADGTTWRQSLSVDPATGAVLFPSGIQGNGCAANLLINNRFSINQRLTVLGAVPANTFCLDRWRTGSSGATITQSAGLTTLAAGSITQNVETSVFQLSDIAGAALTFSVTDFSGGDLTITIAGQVRSLLQAATARSVTINVPANFTGNIPVTLAPVSGAVTFRSVRLEVGSIPTAGIVRTLSEEMALCGRYFQKSHASNVRPGTPSSAAPGTASTAAGLYYTSMRFVGQMQRTPTMTAYNSVTGTAGTWRTGGGTNLTPTIDASDNTVSIFGSGAEANTLVYGHFTADAEI